MAKGVGNAPDGRMVHGGYSMMWERALGGGVDGRTRLARAMNALRNQLVRDVGGDPSAQEGILIDRAVVKVFRLQALEMAMLEGNADKAEAFYISLSNSLRHDLQALGLERRAKDITDLNTYIEEHYGEDTDDNRGDDGC